MLAIQAISRSSAAFTTIPNRPIVIIEMGIDRALTTGAISPFTTPAMSETAMSVGMLPS